MSLKLGIGITTYNRRELVLNLVAEIRRLTGGNYSLVVCDDGSTDGTREALNEAGEVVIGGVNRGIAWNKNRGIYYLMVIKNCDVVILLDDDILPVERNWDQMWIEAAQKFGHVNFAFPQHIEELPLNSCIANNPGMTLQLGGPCMSFNKLAWSLVGYMDPRFGRYGHEHTEYSIRFLKNGLGGLIRASEGKFFNYFFVISGGLKMLLTDSTGSFEDTKLNQLVWEQIQEETSDTFKLPWYCQQQKSEFLEELKSDLASYRIEVTRQYPLFLNTRYLDYNPDVKESTFDPWFHFEHFGIIENREIG